jgi:hypothetical protein
MKKNKLILAALILLVSVSVFHLAHLAFRWLSNDVAKMRHLDDKSWLAAAIRADLYRYHGEHGRYPQTLFDLNIPFPENNVAPEVNFRTFSNALSRWS